ncbi:hypothetical protein [Klebsiella variicola]|uniref:hypothetical protein n=1 Tax=Klebsiella variicola TaxID=244366 RepID=UPI00207C8C70|nr:hypothetical protein [Klebsiella variicola]
MTSKLTRERIEQYANDPRMCNINDEIRQMARMALAAMDGEPVAWGNGCDKTVPAALRYLAENERPFGGESRFNAAHLYQLAREIELMAEAPLYRHAQQPVVPDESYQQLSELYHAQEKRLFKIAQRIKGPAFDKYSHSPSQAIDVLEVAIFGDDESCRAAMLAAAPQSPGSEPATVPGK